MAITADELDNRIEALEAKVTALEAKPANDPNELLAERASNDFMSALIAKINVKTYAQQVTMYTALTTALTPL
jgi:hypothetical protein